MVLGLVVVAESRAWLHGIRHQPVVDDLHAGDMRRCLDRRVGRLGIADLPVEYQIVLGLGMDLRRALFERLGGFDDGLQFLVGDLDRLCRITGLPLGLGHDDDDGVTDIAHLVDGQRRPGAHLHRRTVLGMDHPAADEVADAIGLELLAGQHADDAGHGLRSLDVDLLDLRMRVRAAHEGGMLHAGNHHVVDIAAGAGDESFVFLARDPSADTFNAHQKFLPRLQGSR
ncbi:hypothetical protein ACVILI_004439 [Mesorhizobium sp. USDA 4775]